MKRDRLLAAGAASVAIALGVSFFLIRNPGPPSRVVAEGDAALTETVSRAPVIDARESKPASRIRGRVADEEEADAAESGPAEGSLILQILNGEKRPVPDALVAVFRDVSVIGRGSTNQQGIVTLAGSEGAASAVIFPSATFPSVHALAAAQGHVILILPAGEVVAGRVVVDGDVPRRPVTLWLAHGSSVASAMARSWPQAVDAWLERQPIRFTAGYLRGSTAERGEFVFSGLPSDWSGTLHVWWGYTWEDPRAGPIVIDAPRKGIEIRLHAWPHITGRIVSHGTRVAVVGAIVDYRFEEKDGGGHQGTARSDRDGVFVVVLPDRNDFVAGRLTAATDHKAGERTVELVGSFDEDRDVGDIELSEPLTVDVAVVDSAGLPIAGAALTAEPIPDGPGVLRPEQLSRTDRDGRARFQVTKGIAEIRIIAPGYEAARIRPPETVTTLQIVLQRATRLTVEAKVKGGGDATRATVIEIESTAHLVGTSDGYVDPLEIAAGAGEPEWGGCIGPKGGKLVYQSTKVVIGGIRPGIPFVVRARDTLSGAASEQRLTMSPGEWKSLIITLEQATRRLHGRVLSEDGVPVARAWLQIGETSDWRGTRTGTDRDGSFDFGQVAAAEVLMSIGTSWSEKIQVPKHGEEVIIKLPAPRTLSVKVVDSSGKPVAGARVSPRHPKTGHEIYGVLTGDDGSVIFEGMPTKDLRIVTEFGVTSVETVLRDVPEQATIRLPPSGTVSVSWRFKLLDNPGDLRLESLDRARPALRKQVDYFPLQENFTCLIEGVPPGRYRVHLDQWSNDLEKDVPWIAGPEVEVLAGRQTAVTLSR